MYQSVGQQDRVAIWKPESTEDRMEESERNGEERTTSTVSSNYYIVELVYLQHQRS